MVYRYLLPARYRRIGWWLLWPAATLGLLNMYASVEIPWLRLHAKKDLFFFGNQNLTDEVALTGLLFALLLLSFSRMRYEDEYIGQLRLESWQWAVLLNFLLLLAATWLLYGSSFFNFMVYNMITIPVLFLIRFRWLLYRNGIRNAAKEEA